MANQPLNKITNANIYINGNSLLGKAAEVDMPMVKHKFVEQKAMGLIGTPEFWSGIEKMEMKVKWNSFYSDALGYIANPTQTVQLQLRASLESYDSTGLVGQVPVVIYVTASPKDFPGGSFKQHDNVEVETNFAVYYIKQEIAGAAILEIDVLANIYKVNGVDILATYKANIGG